MVAPLVTVIIIIWGRGGAKAGVGSGIKGPGLPRVAPVQGRL